MEGVGGNRSDELPSKGEHGRSNSTRLANEVASSREAENLSTNGRVESGRSSETRRRMVLPSRHVTVDGILGREERRDARSA